MSQNDDAFREYVVALIARDSFATHPPERKRMYSYRVGIFKQERRRVSPRVFHESLAQMPDGFLVQWYARDT